MKKISYKQKQYDKEMRRMKRISKATPEQNEIAAKNLISRIERKSKIRNELIRILSSEENLAIADIQRELEINRNTFNYWINIFEKEKIIRREIIKCEGEEKRGQPKTLILNKKFLEAREKDAIYNKKSFEEKHLKSIFRMELIEEIEKNPSKKQHQRLIKLFQKFGVVDVGGKIMFLLHTDFIKVDYKFSITDKGKKALAKLKKKKSNS